MSVTSVPSQCLFCAHFRSPLDGFPERTCDAFPTRIPADVWASRVDHRQPVDGDNGVTWAPADGATYPDWALAPADIGGVTVSDGTRSWSVSTEDAVGFLEQVRQHRRDWHPTD